VKFFDTHCHLNHHSFLTDIDSVLKRAVDSGVQYILVPGWDLASSQKAVELSEKYPLIYAAVGIHPGEVQNNTQILTTGILELASHPKVVAIGEIGLDYFRDAEHQFEQQALLLQMLSIASQTKKKVLLHSRNSMPDMIDVLTTWAGELKTVGHTLAECPGVFHAYEGTRADATYLIEFGFKFGVGGPVTYKNAALKKEVFASLPVDHILLETDSPYLSPQGHRGKRNEPAFLPVVGEFLSEIQGQPKDELLLRIYENSYKMFIEDINL
jgi:TatD DNase family protein